MKGWPQEHLLRAVRKSLQEIQRAIAENFDGLYANTGRPVVSPERPPAALLQILTGPADVTELNYGLRLLNEADSGAAAPGQLRWNKRSSEAHEPNS